MGTLTFCPGRFEGRIFARGPLSPPTDAMGIPPWGHGVCYDYQVGRADYVGVQFNGRIVTGLARERRAGVRKKLERTWLVRCLACGDESTCDQKRLRKVGCWRCKQAAYAATRAKPPSDIVMASILSHWNHQNAIKGRPAWSPTVDRVRELVTSPCTYCGALPHRERRYRGHVELVHGVDRIETTRGYEEGNVATCCWECNRAKGATPVGQWVAWLRRAAAHLRL